MKRSISILLTLAALLTLLCGCGAKDAAKTGESTDIAPETAVSMYDLRKAMLEQDKNLPEMSAVSSIDEKADELFTYLSDMDYSKVESYFLTFAADGTSYEIAVVALKQRSDLSELQSSLRKHVEGRVNLYKSYAPEQVARAEGAEIVSSGRYVALIMCDDQAAVKAAFQSGVE